MNAVNHTFLDQVNASSLWESFCFNKFIHLEVSAALNASYFLLSMGAFVFVVIQIGRCGED